MFSHLYSHCLSIFLLRCPGLPPGHGLILGASLRPDGTDCILGPFTTRKMLRPWSVPREGQQNCEGSYEKQMREPGLFRLEESQETLLLSTTA